MSTHLTVDLDYWTADTRIHGVSEYDDFLCAYTMVADMDQDFTDAEKHHAPLDRKVHAFITKVLKAAPDVFVVPQHHQISAHLHALEFDRLINVDYHSDLPERDSESYLLRRRGEGLELNEGSWGLFIPNPGEKEFIWRCPSRRCKQDGVGGCHSSPEENPFTHPGCHNFAKVRSIVGLKSLPWDDITSASICLSMAWWGVEANCTFDRQMLPNTLKLLGLTYDQAKALRHPYILQGKPEFNTAALLAFSRKMGSRMDGRPMKPRSLAGAVCYP
jgi:hypothetical protein